MVEKTGLQSWSRIAAAEENRKNGNIVLGTSVVAEFIHGDSGHTGN